MIETLLAPVRADAPCGDDLSFAPAFDAIAELRREDDATLDQGDWVAPLKAADWPGVLRACEALLTDRSKDLRLTAWWAEAATRVRGLAGLRDGLRLVAGLCERYWDTLHPPIDDGDAGQRVGNLAWLLARLPDWCAQVALCDGGAAGRFSQRDIDAARSRAAAPQADQGPGQAERGAEAQVRWARIQKAQRATPAGFHAVLLEDAASCVQALADLQAVVDARLGDDGPGFATARDALDAMLGTARRLAREAGVGPAGARGAAVTDAAAATAGISTGTGTGTGAGVDADGAFPAAGPVATRAEALRRLREVAEFFRRTEPHSPVAYLADKAARWGELPLHLWLRAVVKDPGALAQLDDLLGVEPPAAPQE